MDSKEALFDQIKSVIKTLFDLEDEQLILDAELYEDLDIDSIDAIDLIIELKRITGKEINPSIFKDVKTLGDVVDSVANL